MDEWSESIGRLGFDAQNRIRIMVGPAGENPGLLDPPNINVNVYKQFPNDFMKDVVRNSTNNFGRRFVGITGTLKFQARNTPHQHILLFSEGGVTEDCTT